MNKYGIREIEDLNEVDYNGIEKNIHVIWKGNNPPDCYHKEIVDWINFSGCDWMIYGWRDEDLNFIKENADDYGKKVFEVAESMNEIAAYVDIIRLYIVYLYGGYYFDADFEVYREISELSHINADFIFCNSTDFYYPSISNSFFAAKKNHPFLKFCIDCLINKYENNEMEDWIIVRTGPIFLGHAYLSYKGEINPIMLQTYYFYSNRKNDVYVDDIDGKIKTVIENNDKSFAKHLFNSSGEYENFN